MPWLDPFPPLRASKCPRPWSPILLAWVSIAEGCTPQLPLIPRGPHPPSMIVRPVLVEGKPPAVKVQVVPAPPHSDCVWLDGEWQWQNHEWRWTSGTWLTPSDRCYYADSVFVWLAAPDSPSGVLYHTPSRWYDRTTQEPCDPPPPCRKQ